MDTARSETALQYGNQSRFIGRNSEGFWECSLCGVSVCYEGMLEDHLAGKLHLRNLRNSQWEKSVVDVPLGSAPVSTASNVSTPTVATTHPSITLPTAQMLSWRNDPQYSGYRELTEQCCRQFYPDGETLCTFGVIPVIGERPSTVWGESPAMDDAWDSACKLCDAQLGDWFQWAQHMQGRKHRENVKAARWSCAQFWQRLVAGKFPYYYEHLTGTWCLEPPTDPFPDNDVYIDALKQNSKSHGTSKCSEESTESLGPSRAGAWEQNFSLMVYSSDVKPLPGKDSLQLRWILPESSVELEYDSDGDLVRRQRTVDYTLQCGSTCTDLTSVGGQLWSGALFLGCFLASIPSIIRGKTVLELASGVGALGGLYHALSAKKATLTDCCDAALSLCTANNSKYSEITVKRLDFKEANTFTETFGEKEEVDLILASDVWYDFDINVALGGALEVLMVRFPKARVILCCEERLNIVHPAVPPIDVFAQHFMDEYTTGKDARFRIRELAAPAGSLKRLALEQQHARRVFDHCKLYELSLWDDRGFFAGRDEDGSWRCTLCDVSVCHEGIFLSHMQGEKHAKRLRSLQWEEQERRKVATSTSCAPETEVEACEPLWRKDAQYTGFRDMSEQCARQFFPDGRSMAFCGIIAPFEERPPNTWGEVPAVDDGWDVTCRLCDAQLGDWYQWSLHMQAKKHRANVKSCRWSYATFWQKLTAGGFPYYYEHLTGMWTLEPPSAVFNGDVFIEPFVRNAFCNPDSDFG
ncbi:hypothetical protein FOL47_010823 [Perkinsus chesapeaki]|uniref:C2H2-type domain-containing protein n=1 Tax=Perkinsus chesapeaki TaxID=330153 RepID=A0A7J6MNP8_PERCH|nr:hypothetical protein FOL47_010823 [Perkinsus chesapeaki]